MQEIRSFIAGEHVSGASWFDKRSPVDGRLIARVAEAGAAEVDAAVRAARAALAGHVFEGLVAPADLPQLRATRAVTQTLLVEGRHRVRLYEPGGEAPPGCVPVEPSLEDAYLVLMRLGELPGAELIDATAPTEAGASRLDARTPETLGARP